MKTSVISNDERAAIYVGTYAKYNNGSIYGDWLFLSDYENKADFHKACRELHKDEADPEFMFQDYMNIPSELVDECWISEIAFVLAKAFESYDDERKEAFDFFMNLFSYDVKEMEADEIIDFFEDVYQGEYDSEADFAEHLLDETGDLDRIPKDLRYYFDYSAYARDLFMTDYIFDGGHVYMRP